MKKSNISNKRHYNSPTDTISALQLNKSLSSIIDFTNLSSNTHLDHSKEAGIDQNLKPRKHAKAPSKRLALLLDAYSERNQKKHHNTVDNVLEASSRENSSFRSPHHTSNASEILKKSGGFRPIGTSASYKTLDLFKPKESSKLNMYQVLSKANMKSQRYDNEDKGGKDVTGNEESQQVLAGKGPETVEEFKVTPVIPKKISKEKDQQGRTRNERSKKGSKLRTKKVLFTEASMQERSAAASNTSQPLTAKHVGSTSLTFTTLPNSAVSLLNRIIASQDKRKREHLLVSQARSPATLRHHEVNKSVQYIDYYSVQQPHETEPAAAGAQEVDKKNQSALIPTKRGPQKSGVPTFSLPIKDIQMKGNSGTTTTTKLNTDTDRDLVVHNTSGERQVSKRPHSNMREMMSNRRQGEQVTKRFEKSEKEKREESLNKYSNLISLIKLEKAFDLFLEENKQHFDRDEKHQTRLEKIAKAWEIFTETVRALEKGDKSSHRDEGWLTRKKVNEQVLKTLQKEDEASRDSNGKKPGLEILTNQSALPTEKKVFNRGENVAIEKCDTGKGVVQEDLQQIIEKQQKTIDAMKKKEEKMLKLMLAMKKKGIDIEKIYKEEVKNNMSGSTSFERLSAKVNNNLNNSSSRVHEETIVSLQRDGASDLSQSFDISPNLQHGHGNKGVFPIRFNLGLKNVPRLDLTGLNSNNSNKIVSTGAMGSGNGSKGFKLDLKSISGEHAATDDRPGFHEEFMSKIDEFSHSWRQEALNQRDYEE